jgi:pimeloyl-ACP methyl ester carboxylesterase
MEASELRWMLNTIVRNGAMQVNESWMEIDGRHMRFLHAGSGPPVLLLGGLLGGAFCWRLTVPALASRYSVFAVDLPGSGLSSDSGMDCCMSQQVRRLAAFVDKMAWDELSVVGSSYGGAIAMLLAADDRLKTKIRSLVLSSPVNPWSGFGQGRIQFLSSRLGACVLRTLLPISRPVHGLALRRMYGDPRQVTEEAVRGYRATILRRGRAKNILTALRSWQQDVSSLDAVIPRLHMPTLLIWGTCDKAVDPRSATILTERLPCAQLKLISGAGHLPFEEAPDEFNRLTLEFLARNHLGQVACPNTQK